MRGVGTYAGRQKELEGKKKRRYQKRYLCPCTLASASRRHIQFDVLIIVDSVLVKIMKRKEKEPRKKSLTNSLSSLAGSTGRATKRTYGW
jgi:hypothetical protein